LLFDNKFTSGLFRSHRVDAGPDMRKNFLPFSPPAIGEEEIAEVVETLRSGWITTGPRTHRFEGLFAAAVGAPQCLALSSCTAALHLALVSLGIGPGDAVLTTPMTFCSGVHVIEQTGARPILVDVEPDTLNIDPQKLRDLIRRLRHRRGAPRLRAILPVHLHGHPCELDQIVAIAEENQLAVIEDAAHALPARYNGRLVGAQLPSWRVPVLTCFSFYATKNMTTAEGGMLAGLPGAIEEARTWSLHGMSRDAWKRYGEGGSWRYDVIHAGFKYNMTDIQAAIGIHQLAKLAKFHARRKEIAGQYNQAFAELESLQVPAQRANVDHAWHVYPLRLHLDHLSISRDLLIEKLATRQIGSSVHFIPIHLHRYYREKYGYRPGEFPVAYREFQRMVSLPLHPGMSDQDVGDVIEGVLGIVREHSLRRLHAVKNGASLGARQDLSRDSASGVRFLRQLFDRFSAGAGLLLLLPVFACIALAIKFDDGGPVFFSQFRVGKGLRKFRLLKFRSMVPSFSRGGLLTAPQDDRVTRVGRFLRARKLDELPQLLNVLKGEMQLVGVRPQMERFVEAYPEQYEELLRVPPGITDLASLYFRNEENLFREGSIEQQYVERILPVKLQISLDYHRARTFFSDLDILFRTALGLHCPPPRSKRASSGIASLPKTISRNV
jgi:dTDP-4-amino-4,6-dideoxygalactose transaminase/lipopolysaccharide/colanic/teichoic acid biosynthesis glycosyltransferase